MNSDTTENSLAKPPGRKRRSVIRPLLLLLVLIALTVVLFPPAFRFTAGLLIRFAAWKEGAEFTYASIEGSVFEPLHFSQISFSVPRSAGGSVEGHIADAVICFTPQRLIVDRDRPVVDSVTIKRGEIRVLLSGIAEAESHTGPAKESRVPWHLFPGRIEARELTISLSAPSTTLVLNGAGFTVSQVQAGEFTAESFRVDAPGFQHRFTQLQGSTMRQGSTLSLVSVQLTDQLRLQNASVDLSDWAAGRGNLDFDLDAFGGSIRGELRARVDRPRSKLDASGSFSKIDIAQLAHFAAPGTEADGRINEGKFSFRGSLSRLDRSSGSLRIDATDFRWAKRQWNALVLGATLVDRRLTVTEFKLQQARNSLTGDGQLRIPQDKERWWESEFSFNISARIDDLAQLSALLGPAFARTAGKLRADGSIRGRNKKFAGQLIVSGSDLRYGEAPIDRLHAAIQLNGNEFQLANFELIRNDDFIHGHGVMNILGAKQYWGEIDASVADLSIYKTLMQPPLAPAPAAGGLKLSWSGDGNARAHSGAFHAELRKLQPLAGDGKWLPLNATLEATYSPDSIYFTKFNFAQDDLQFSAVVNASPQSTTLDKVSLARKTASLLRGRAVLPVSFWGLWKGAPRADVFNANGELQFTIDAQGLLVRDLFRLAGRSSALRGEISAKLQGSGSLSDLAADGTLSLNDVEIPGAVAGTLVRQLHLDGKISGHILTTESFSAQLLGGRAAATGEINFKNIGDPNLRLNVTTQGTQLRLAENGSITCAATLSLNGPVSAAYLDGGVVITGLSIRDAPDFGMLFRPASAFSLDYLFRLAEPVSAPFSDWRYNVALTCGKPVGVTDRLSVQPNLQLSGRGETAELSGEVNFKGSLTPKAESPVTSFEGTLYLGAEPRVAARGAGSGDFTAYVVGPLAERRMVFIDEHVATPELLPASKGSLPSLGEPIELHLARSGAAHDPIPGSASAGQP